MVSHWLRRAAVVAILAACFLPPSANAGKGHCGTSPTCYHKDRGHHAKKHTATDVLRDDRGRIKRSTSAKREFQREHACPSTGKTSGSCPGYVIDHVQALCKGGADAPSNMQWQTIAEGKAKDRVECR
jgi:hypothetical protein